MSIIKNYLKATPLIKAVTSTYLSPEQFLQLYKAATDEERRILLRHVVRFNTPYVFRDKPLLYEYIRQYLADILQLEVQDVLLIGSAKTGFSMSTDQYGKAFSSKSDLDFTIVSKPLFDILCNEYHTWHELYTNGQEKPSIAEQNYWDANINTLERTIDRRFIDTTKLPNRMCCPTNMMINNAMYLIKTKLELPFQITISHASVRVYNDINAFYRQLKINTNRLLPE